MKIKYKEEELVLETSESEYLKFSDEIEYKKIFEIEERDALADFDVLEKYHKEWKSRGHSLCISLQHSTDINILKLLQLHPDYVSLPWPFARNASVHKAVTEVISFVLNRGIKVIAYCPHGVGAPQLFSGVVQQKPYH